MLFPPDGKSTVADVLSKQTGEDLFYMNISMDGSQLMLCFDDGLSLPSGFIKTDLDPNLHVVCGSWHSPPTEITLLTKPHRMSSLWSQKWYHPNDPRCLLLLGDHHTDITFL